MNAKCFISQLSLLALLLTFAEIQSASAQGTAFTYQGRLTFEGGSASGNFDLTFKLFDDAVAGNQIGNNITNANLSLSNGLVTVQLDFGASTFPGAGRWLQIGVRTNGSADDFTTLSPRQPVTSTPYAIKAANFTGVVEDSQLSANVPRLDGSNVFTGTIKSVNGDTEFFMVPKGLVALWSGNAATIPAGWALCDGTVGTPDLRDRFVVGAGSTYVVGDTGGATNHTHSTDIDPVTSSTAGAHTHTVDVASTTSSTSATHTHDVNPASATTSSDAHTHTGGTLTFSREVSVPASPNGTGGFYFSLTTGTQSTGIDPVWGGATGSDSHSHTVDVANTTSTASGAHSHTVDPAAVISDSQGAHSHAVDPPATTSTASDSRPPYYALCYIMKL